MNVTALAAAPLRRDLENRAADWWRNDHQNPSAASASEEERQAYRSRVLAAVDAYDRLSPYEQSQFKQLVDMRRISPRSALMRSLPQFQRLGLLRAKPETEPGPDGEHGVIASLSDMGRAGSGLGLQSTGEPWQ